LLAEYSDGGRLTLIHVDGDRARVETLSEIFSHGVAAVTVARGHAWVLEYRAADTGPFFATGVAFPGE
jgi:hypothetical protein